MTSLRGQAVGVGGPGVEFGELVTGDRDSSPVFDLAFGAQLVLQLGDPLLVVVVTLPLLQLLEESTAVPVARAVLFDAGECVKSSEPVLAVELLQAGGVAGGECFFGEGFLRLGDEAVRIGSGGVESRQLQAGHDRRLQLTCGMQPPYVVDQALTALLSPRIAEPVSRVRVGVGIGGVGSGDTLESGDSLTPVALLGRHDPLVVPGGMVFARLRLLQAFPHERVVRKAGL